MKYDVIVVGGGPAGVPAAVAARRMGLKTLLVEKSAILGGLAVSGLPILGYFDRTGRKVLGGIAWELLERLKETGSLLGPFRCPVHNSLAPVNPHWLRIECFEMCRESGVDVLLYTELMDVKVDNGKIAGITTFSKGEAKSFETEILIDATGDAVAAYMAGAEYMKNDQLQPGSLTFTIGNVDIKAVVEYVRTHPETIELPDSYGVSQTMEQFTEAIGFAFTGYREFIDRAVANGEFSLPRDRIIFTTLPNSGEVMVNSTRVNNVDTSKTEDVIRGDFECYRQIKELMMFFKKYAPGFENCYLTSISNGFGSRESRRIKGIRTLTMEDLNNLEVSDDSIVLAGYNVDIHVPGTDRLYLQPVEKAIGIPYGCLVSSNVDGLMMAGRDISVDNEVYGLTRIMGTCMGTGEAAGTAAAIAFSQGISPRQVSVSELREILRTNGCIVD